MFLTLQQAIELCIELWEWCAETGKCKKYWPKWQQYSMYYDRNGTFAGTNFPHHPRAFAWCWFCLYAKQQAILKRKRFAGNCFYCPIQQIFGHCTRIKNYTKWWSAGSAQFKEKKKYAAAFLEELKTITYTED